MDKRILAQRLVELRKKSGLNQRQAAEKLGISPAPLSAYELGKKLPPLETLASIAEQYGVSCAYLLGQESVRLGEQANLAKSIAELLLSGRVRRIETADENLNKVIKNISAICNSAQLSHEDKIEFIEAYIQNLRE